MYLVYADESGDPGLPGDTEFFVISGLIIHESDWNEVFQRFLDLRRNLSLRYQIPQRIVFNAYDLVNGHKDFHHSRYGLKGLRRFDLYRDILDFLSQLPQIHILNVFIRKQRISDPNTDIFIWAWQLFIQRLHNSLDRGGYLCQDNDYGLLVTDRTHDDELRRLMRRMRAFNQVPSQYAGLSPRRILVTRMIDDPLPRPSAHSYFLQMADLAAYALARRDFPRPTLKKLGFEAYFDILDPVLLKAASGHDPQGIVYYPR
jgi:hypothetical protein